MIDGSGDSTVSSVDHKAHKSKEIQTSFFCFKFLFFLSTGFLMLPSASSDSKNHMLVAAKRTSRMCLFFSSDVLFFLFSKRLNN